MPIARREEVLARMSVVLGGIAGIVTNVRNRGLLDNDKRPAIVLLDGDEIIRTGGERRGRTTMQPAIVRMTPQIFILLKTKKPTNADVGKDLNDFRGKVLSALASDAELKALIGPNGDLSYQGCITDLKTGMTLEGEMQISLYVDTVFDPYR